MDEVNSIIGCRLCPHHCDLAPGEMGVCRVRRNTDSQIECITYGHPCTVNIDPIEKKPLFHFIPGSSIFSVATPGCNLRCAACQNWPISQSVILNEKEYVSANELVQAAKIHKMQSIAYTYAEPLVSFEYTLECCKLAKDIGMHNVLVTAAYLNKQPLEALCCYVDAANVDLKGFTDEFYRKYCGASLKPVLKALEVIKNCSVMVEVTYLIIPTLNDSKQELLKMCRWIFDFMGPETPLHFTQFSPQYRLKNLPETPVKTLKMAREIALSVGLQFVYLGNINDSEAANTYCPSCSELLIERRGYAVIENRIAQGSCPVCQFAIHGVWG